MSKLVWSLKGSHEKGLAHGRCKEMSARLTNFMLEEVRSPRVLLRRGPCPCHMVHAHEDMVEWGQVPSKFAKSSAGTRDDTSWS